jgi:hypothetical protein
MSLNDFLVLLGIQLCSLCNKTFPNSLVCLPIHPKMLDKMIKLDIKYKLCYWISSNDLLLLNYNNSGDIMSQYAMQPKEIRQEFILEVVAQKMHHEINQFDISLTDKLSALRMVISMLIKNSIRIVQ